jgi:hypothetical protein
MEDVHMRIASWAIVPLAVAMLAACDSPKGTAQVARDTVAAEQAAADTAAKAQQRADARIASAQADVRDEQRDLAHVDAVEGQKIADAQAGGDYKAAQAQCESLGGATQKACRDQASADYEAAKARAKQSKAATDPRP